MEIQDSAYPYHDWNERITAECYATNAAARILDGSGRIKDIVSNYAKISFDIGPTLLRWLEKHSPGTYQEILKADRQSIEWRSGHGAAMAQAFNHIIMPLANTKDKRTQVIWGIRDFMHRFGRTPEGMWLPETAVDLETLAIMAESGIKFTLLAPHQAKRVRRIGKGEWNDVSGKKIDPKQAYLIKLGNGLTMNIFFYDSPISHAVAFEGLLSSGEKFSDRLLTGFADTAEPQLMHICTDGESYGHHHKFGEMALAYALNRIEGRGQARITNYGEFLHKNPPQYEVEIFENTSWSCAHGVERWKSDCGCSSGRHPGWSQKWRAPLREALDWLRDSLSAPYEAEAALLFKDPWSTRDDYIDIILDRSAGNLESFFGIHASRPFDEHDRVRAMGLLELQRHAMLMYTSCGWFFDDISGIETLQIIEYAGRAIQLARKLLGKSLEKEFIERLRAAKSNVPQFRDGAHIYETVIMPYSIDLKKVAAHYVISSIFDEFHEEEEIYCYRVKSLDSERAGGGKPEMIVGKCVVTSEITGESETMSYAALHLGNHDLNCGVRRSGEEKAYADMKEELMAAFQGGALADVVRLMDRHFSLFRYTLKDLFRDEQRKILEILISETTQGFEASYKKMFDENRILMGFLKETGIPVPKAFVMAAEFILNLELVRLIREDTDIEGMDRILREFEKWNIAPDAVELEYTIRLKMQREMAALLERPEDLPQMKLMERLIGIAQTLPVELNLWSIQNSYYRLAKSALPALAPRAKSEEKADEWVRRFRSVGEKLNFNVEAVL